MIAYLKRCAGCVGNLPAQRRFPGRLILAIIAAWSVVVTAGLCALWHYSAIAGDGGAPPTSWPVHSKVIRDGRPTLLVFVHPFCPCTRATLAELDRLVAVCRDQVDIHVLFIAPDGTDASWLDTDLYRVARRIPSVGVSVDTHRYEADLFRMQTSGSCLLYDESGKLLFHGGLTAARGHEGDNQGSKSIKALLMHKDDEPQETPVFGCPLFETENRSTRADHCSEQELNS
jgi:hypothetical protein